MDLIEIKNLSKIYYPTVSLIETLVSCGKPRKRLIALNKIDLQVREGELFCLFGPNKSGKSTLLKIIASLVQPTQGSISIAGKDLIKEADQIKGMVSLVQAEERSFYWRLTGRENLYFFGSFYNIPLAQLKNKIEELFALLEIKDPDTMFQEYSSGMKQRLSIARGLLNDPKIILMDEPAKGLDFLIAQKIRNFIRQELIEKRRKTILYTTHSLAEAKEISDRTAFIDAGAIKDCYDSKCLKALEDISHVFTSEIDPGL